MTVLLFSTALLVFVLDRAPFGPPSPPDPPFFHYRSHGGWGIDYDLWIWPDNSFEWREILVRRNAESTIKKNKGKAPGLFQKLVSLADERGAWGITTESLHRELEAEGGMFGVIDDSRDEVDFALPDRSIRGLIDSLDLHRNYYPEAEELAAFSELITVARRATEPPPRPLAESEVAHIRRTSSFGPILDDAKVVVPEDSGNLLEAYSSAFDLAFPLDGSRLRKRYGEGITSVARFITYREERNESRCDTIAFVGAGRGRPGARPKVLISSIRFYRGKLWRRSREVYQASIRDSYAELFQDQGSIPSGQVWPDVLPPSGFLIEIWTGDDNPTRLACLDAGPLRLPMRWVWGEAYSKFSSAARDVHDSIWMSWGDY